MILWLFSAVNILPIGFFPVDFLFYFPLLLLPQEGERGLK